jgi:hypothetical protein
MNGYRAHRVLLALLLVAGLRDSPHDPAAKADEAPARGSEESDETTRLGEADLPHWKLWRGTDRQTELKLEPKPVLRWTNPEIGRVYGDVYVWTADGRPEVVMSLLKAWEPADVLHAEMHTLSLGALEAERAGQQVWQPMKPGLGLHDVPGAPKPAATPVRRLSQMRALAGEFSAELTDYRRNPTGERQPLRLLTQPIYRYQTAREELLDGGMFAFVLGTDPEVFLLLEARQGPDGARWQFGLARMNPDPVAVTYREDEVWHLPRADLQDPLHDPYALIRLPESPH